MPAHKIVQNCLQHVILIFLYKVYKITLKRLKQHVEDILAQVHELNEMNWL